MPEQRLRKIAALARQALAGDGTRLELRAALILILEETRRATGEPTQLRSDRPAPPSPSGPEKR